jgi:hypothetical protein
VKKLSLRIDVLIFYNLYIYKYKCDKVSKSNINKVKIIKNFELKFIKTFKVKNVFLKMDETLA